jgi:hypothetical protein
MTNQTSTDYFVTIERYNVFQANLFGFLEEHRKVLADEPNVIVIAEGVLDYVFSKRPIKLGQLEVVAVSDIYFCNGPAHGFYFLTRSHK